MQRVREHRAGAHQVWPWQSELSPREPASRLRDDALARLVCLAPQPTGTVGLHPQMLLSHLCHGGYQDGAFLILLFFLQF